MTDTDYFLKKNMKLYQYVLIITLITAFAFLTVAIEFDSRFTAAFCVNGELFVCFRETGLERVPPFTNYSVTARAVFEKSCFNPAERPIPGFTISSEADVAFDHSFSYTTLYEIDGCFSAEKCPPPPQGECPPALRFRTTCRYTDIVLTDTRNNIAVPMSDATCLTVKICI